MTIRVEPVDGAPDASFWNPGEGFFFSHRERTIVGMGGGEAILVPGGGGQVARAAERVRTALERTGSPDTVAVGAVPFDGLAQAAFSIPETTLTSDARGSRAILAGNAGWVSRVGLVTHGHEPLRITPVPEPGAYVDAVGKARARIHAGELDKVVLARMLVAQATHVLDRRALLARLAAAEQDAYTFAVQGFIGASPELLVARSGRRIVARPLAGTISRGADDDAAARALLASEKDRHEHALVVEAVRAALEPTCEELAVDETPQIVTTSKVLHLGTSFRGTMRDPETTALDLAALLHPTPAVCGTPTDAARTAITELEEIDRALYAGLVGWQDARGDGEFAVVLRCAEVSGRIALLFAGAGIVADSDPQAELAETDAKFRGMLEALGYA